MNKETNEQNKNADIQETKFDVPDEFYMALFFGFVFCLFVSVMIS